MSARGGLRFQVEAQEVDLLEVPHLATERAARPAARATIRRRPGGCRRALHIKEPARPGAGFRLAEGLARLARQVADGSTHKMRRQAEQRTCWPTTSGPRRRPRHRRVVCLWRVLMMKSMVTQPEAAGQIMSPTCCPLRPCPVWPGPVRSGPAREQARTMLSSDR